MSGIFSQFSAYSVTILPSSSGRKISYPPAVDEQLVQFVLQEQKNGVLVQPEMIRREAKKLIQPFCNDFKASTGWLEKFLSRNQLSLHPPKNSPTTGF